MADPLPGQTHHVVIGYGPPANRKWIGLMMPFGPGKSLPFVAEPYNQFGLQMRQGMATESDRSALACWEFFRDLSAGAEYFVERDVEFNGYAFGDGFPCLFTAHKGLLMPAPSYHSVSTARKDLFAFCEAPWGKLYALSNANPGVVYEFAADGLSVVAKETLSTGGNTVGKQLATDGTTLFATRGASKAVRKSTDGAAWSDHTFNADFVCIRERGVLCYVAGATFYPVAQTGESYGNVVVGWSGTTATNLVAFNGGVYIFKPEGVYRWAYGTVEPIFDAKDFYSSENGAWACVHGSALFFNIRNRVYYTLGRGVQELSAGDRDGFYSIDCMASTFGPLLLGASVSDLMMDPLQRRGALYSLGGAADSGLNPLFSPNEADAGAAYSSEDAVAAEVAGADVAWTNPGESVVADSVYATVALNTFQSSKVINITQCGFAVPAGAVISSIAVEITGYVESGDESCLIYAGLLGCDADGTRVNGVALPATAGVVLIDPPLGTAHWATAPTVAQINSDAFGVCFHVNNGAAAGRPGFYIDSVRIRVAWSTGTRHIGACATRLFGSAMRIYDCESATRGLGFVEVTDRYIPRHFGLTAIGEANVELIEFSAGIPSIPKWFYDCIIAVRDPSASTTLRVEYSIDGRVTWHRLVDENGVDTDITLDERVAGAYFPASANGLRISLRLSLAQSDVFQAAMIERLSVRGLVMTEQLFQFSFPVLASKTVPGKQAGVSDEGEDIVAALAAASTQGYPVLFGDIHGNWHLCAFRTSPLEVPAVVIQPGDITPLSIYPQFQLNLVEVARLGANGVYNPWSIG